VAACRLGVAALTAFTKRVQAANNMNFCPVNWMFCPLLSN
jgi:hypothetical protein